MNSISETGLSLSPYPGLRPFRRDEADIFFGREEQVDQLLGKLETCRFLAVVGVSGCGKSSLVRAGMLSALESGFMASAGPRWHVVEMRPGGHPLANLAQALLRGGLLGESWRDREDAEAFVCAVLRRGPLGLVELMRESLEGGKRKAESGQQSEVGGRRSEVGDTDSQLSTLDSQLSTTHHSPLTTKNLLLLVDQFEEIFRFHKHGDAGEATAFVDLLLHSAQQTDVPIYVVLTMRSDFLGDCSIFADLPEAINDGQFLIPRLTREQCRAAVAGPAAAFGATVQPELVNHVLNDIGSNPDQLPLMQHALMRVWNGAVKGVESGELRVESQKSEVRGQRSDVEGQDHSPLTTHHSPLSITLTLADYEAVGGLKNALSNHADELFASLTENDQRIAETLFRCLSERGADGRDIRRPVPLQAVAEVAQVSPETIVRIVDVFREPTCSFLTPPAGTPLQPDTVLDISHESLIRQWHRMAGWVQAEADSAAIYRRLSETAVLWKRDRAALWDTPDLENALAWRDRERPNAIWAQRYGGSFAESMAFLDASVQAHDLREQQEKERQERERALLQNMARAEKQRADEAEERRKEQTTANALLKRRAITAVGAGVVSIVLAVAAFILYAQAKAEQERADVARQDAEVAKQKADEYATKEAEARKRSQEAELKALEAGSDAYANLGQANLAQLKSLWSSNEPGRQVKALKLLRNSADLRGTSMQFARRQDEDSRLATRLFWQNLTPQLREQAVRWLSLTSLQQIRGIPVTLSSSSTSRFMQFALDAEGKRLAVFKPEERYAGELQIVDVLSGNVLTSARTPADMRQLPVALSFSTDGKTLLVATGSGSATAVQHRSATDLSPAKTVRMATAGLFRSSAYYGDREDHWFDASGKRFIYSGRYGVGVWNAETGGRIYAGDQNERAAKVTRLSETLPVIRNRKSIALVNLKDGTTLKDFSVLRGNSSINGATLSPNGDWLAVELNYQYSSSGQYDLPLLIVSTKSGETVSRVNLTVSSYSYSSNRTLEVAFHPRRPVLAVLDSQNVSLISVPQGGVLYRARAVDVTEVGRKRFAADHVSFNGSGDLLLTALRDTNYYSSNSGDRPVVLLQLWDPSVASASLQTLALDGAVQDFAFAGEEALAIAGGDDKRTGVQIRPLKGVQPWSTTSASPSGGFEPSGKHYVHVLPNQVDILDAKTGKRLQSINRRWPGQANALPVAKSHRWIVGVDSREKSPRLRLFDASSRKWTHALLGPKATLGSVSLSDDGNAVIVGHSEMQLRKVGRRKSPTRDYATTVLSTSSGEKIFATKKAHNDTRVTKSGYLLTRDYENNDYILRAFEMKTGRKASELRISSSGYTVSLSNNFWLDDDERVAAFRHRDGSATRVYVWPFAEGTEGAPLPTKFYEYYNVDAHVLRDRLIIAGRLPASTVKGKSVSSRYVAQLWDLKNRKLLKSWGNNDSNAVAFRVSETHGKALIFWSTNSANSRTGVWDLKSAEKLAEIPGYPRGISPDGRFAVFSRGEVLDLSNNKLRPSPNDLLITSYHFSKDSRYLVTRRLDGDDATIGVLDLRHPGSSWKLDTGLKSVYQAVLSPDSRFLMTYSYKTPHVVHLTKLKTGERQRAVAIRLGNFRPDVDTVSRLTSFEFSPDSRHYAVVSHDQLRLGNTDAKQVHTELPRTGHRLVVHAVAVSPDRQFVASGSADQTVCFWRANDGTYLGMLEDGGSSSIRTVVFSPKGNRIATRKENGEIVVWELSRSRRTAFQGRPDQPDGAAAALEGHPTEVAAKFLWSNARGDGSPLAFSPDGALIAAGDADGGLRLFNSQTGKLTQWLQPRGVTGGVRALAFRPNGRQIAASRGHVIGLWDAKTGTLSRAWDAKQGPLFDLAFPSDGRFLISTGRDVRIWDPDSAALQLTLDKKSSAVRHVAVSDTGERLAFAVDDRSVVVTNVKELLKSVESLGLKMSPDLSGTAGVGATWTKPLWTPAAGKDVAAENTLSEFLPKAFKAERDQDWKQAVLYLTRLIENDLENAGYRKRRFAANIELKQWKAAAEDASRILDAMPRSEYRTSERSVWLQELLRRRPELFAALEELLPRDALPSIVRGRDLALQSKWQAAKQAYGKRIRLAEPQENWYEYAALCLIAGDRKAYREHLAWMAAQKEQPKGHFMAYAYSRAVAMGDSGLPPATYLAWADAAIKDQRPAWYLHAVGLAHYRAGNYDMARRVLQESMQGTWMPPLNQIAFGLVEYQCGNYEAAKELLEKARDWRKRIEDSRTDGFANVLVPDWVELNVTLPELEALIAKGLRPARPPVKAPKPMKN